MTRATTSAAWQALAAHRDAIAGVTVADRLAAEPDRFAAFAHELGGLLLDLSKTRIGADTLDLLVDLARAADVEGACARMLAGAVVNPTEGRAALHTALRDRSGLTGGGAAAEAEATRQRMADVVRALRGGETTDVVAIGIGGSYLGPLLVARALADGNGPAVHFVANVDGHDLAGVLDAVPPETTEFLVASKTFTTQETLTNAETAKAWLIDRLGADAVAGRFAAMTANLGAAAAFGIPADRVFPIWDWVGGRFSLWSAVGLPAAVALGWRRFEALLDGAHAMDRHFAEAPLAENLPVLAALAGIWHIDFEDLGALAVVPYDERLALLPAYLQQLEMESNGKAVGLDGEPLTAAPAPVVFGEPGTNAQHSFHQWLHQGPRAAAVDFIAAARPGHGLGGHHDTLLANMLAQSEALAFGTEGDGHPHRACPGNRPSATILLEELDARRLGMLIALYEHKVFVQGVIWGLNSFDQFGVELGKRLAKRLLPAVAGNAAADVDSSTAGLLARLRAWRDAVE
ncbi:MAG: glucose-6-phosphate isomerase [Rhodospirillaceae bacterium]